MVQLKEVNFSELVVGDVFFENLNDVDNWFINLDDARGIVCHPDAPSWPVLRFAGDDVVYVDPR